jgi:N-acetylmuramoyl-L-alanine amidase
VLPRIVHQTIVYRLGSRRAFIGDVQPSSFSFRLDPLPNGSRLTLQFSEKINVRTAASNGKWVLFLGDKPVQPLDQRFEFHDPYLSNIQFDDQDGVPKLILTPAVEGLNFYPKMDETGKTLMAEMLKPTASIAQLPPPVQVPETPGVTVLPSVTPPATSTATPVGEPGLPVVVLDAGHGADDTGARGSNGLLEKDLVAQLVARVRSTLLSSRRYRIVLTRVGDVNPGQDQRAAIANAARAEVFVTFHAGNLGMHSPRIAIYTYQPPSTSTATAGDRPAGLLIPWGTIQVSHLSRSQLLADAFQKTLVNIPGVSVSSPTAAPMGVIRGVNAPAIAVEIGSLTPDMDGTPLSATSFQDGVASAVVKAMDAFEGGR